MNVRQIAKALGQRGGRARAATLSAEERTRIASLGGKARSQSIAAARRIAVNLRYARMVRAMRAKPLRVTRMKAFAGPLPGLYPKRRPRV